jgi:hypothetical protein
MNKNVIDEFKIDGKEKVLISPDRKKVIKSNSYFFLLQKNDELFDGQGRIMNYKDYLLISEESVKMKGYQSVMFMSVYLILLSLLLFRMYLSTKELKVPTKYEIIQRNYDSPEDLYGDSTMSIQERNYYEFLYNKE